MKKRFRVKIDAVMEASSIDGAICSLGMYYQNLYVDAATPTIFVEGEASIEPEGPKTFPKLEGRFMVPAGFRMNVDGVDFSGCRFVLNTDDPRFSVLEVWRDEGLKT